jgi:hypothetical protein
MCDAGDAHFKVASAALEALSVGLAGRNSKVFEPLLDRIMPALFLRWAGSTIVGHSPQFVLMGIFLVSAGLLGDLERLSSTNGGRYTMAGSYA